MHTTLIQKENRTDYNARMEGLPGLDIVWETAWGFPWGTQDPKVVGEFLIAYGFLIQNANLPAGAKILEVGCGLGSLTECLARMGYHVDALDVNEDQCEIVRRKTHAFPTQPNIICQEVFNFLIDTKSSYDAVIFFESFHHMLHHADLLKLIRNKALLPGGKIILAAEPIFPSTCPTLPYPWGLRLDGGSLRAMRNWGWIELGFCQHYLEELAIRLNFTFEYQKTDNCNASHLMILTL